MLGAEREPNAIFKPHRSDGNSGSFMRAAPFGSDQREEPVLPSGSLDAFVA